MELPKSITQIGEADPRNKIYVEDYAVAYMKQLNERAVDKPVGVALYGTKKVEGEKTFYFVYAMAKLNSLNKEGTHISAAQKQEIDKLQKQHFKEYAFLGYRILDGKLVEGFYIFEQGLGRYTAGYAQFSEKNDVMLNYMMDYREDTPAAEVVDDAKYVEVKQRQEQRREEAAYYYRKKKRKEFAAIPYAAVACAALLGVTLYRNWDEPVVQRYYQTVKNTLEDVRYNVFGQGNIADSIEVAAEPVQEPVKTKDILVAEDNLNQALLEENAVPDEKGQAGSELESLPIQEAIGESEASAASEQPSESGPVEESAALENTENQEGTPNETVSDETIPEPEVPEESVTEVISGQVEADPITYEVKKGDTLISICMNRYGNQEKIPDICEMNHIINPDNIQEGWKILLP